jgi:predicted RNase H-like HicB family nuclease
MARVLDGPFTVVKGGIEFVFEPAEEGGYVAKVSLYPSCVSQGETFEEAFDNVQDALRETLRAAKDLGLEVPRELTRVVDA